MISRDALEAIPCKVVGATDRQSVGCWGRLTSKSCRECWRKWFRCWRAMRKAKNGS